MRVSFNRRTATKVVDGQTRGKNRRVPTTHRGYVIDRQSPGKGYRHVVTKRDLQDFLDTVTLTSFSPNMFKPSEIPREARKSDHRFLAAAQFLAITDSALE